MAGVNGRVGGGAGSVATGRGPGRSNQAENRARAGTMSQRAARVQEVAARSGVGSGAGLARAIWVGVGGGWGGRAIMEAKEALAPSVVVGEGSSGMVWGASLTQPQAEHITRLPASSRATRMTLRQLSHLSMADIRENCKAIETARVTEKFGRCRLTVLPLHLRT